MAQSLFRFCDKSIIWLFYSLFFLVPLVFVGDTFELFEFNKMWITFIITIFIVLFWLVKSIAEKKFVLQRTPLDIFIVFFFISQLIATIHSLDIHVSIWGYYSRFNGGLLSTITYITLYYAFVSNVTNKGTGNTIKPAARILLFSFGILVFLLGFLMALGPSVTDPTAGSQKAAMLLFFSFIPSLVLFSFSLPGNAIKKLLLLSLTSAALTALWGFPAHYSHDPTCLLFRGSFDIKCWTEAFAPNIRMFSTLGQPDWFGAYLAIIIPIAMAIVFTNIYQNKSKINIWFVILSAALLALLFADLMFSNSKSAFLGGWIGIIFFLLAFVFGAKQKIISAKNSGLALIASVFIGFCAVMFFTGAPFAQVQHLSLPSLLDRAQSPAAPSTSAQPQKTAVKSAASPVGELGGTDSGKIRSYVWLGAINIWKDNPIIGTGVETFAFAYYKYKPIGHNLTSEWDYLYNKAHNEYLNYLATTGAFGLLSYLLMILWFFVLAFKNLPKRIQEKTSNYHYCIVIALIASYISILITDFFGFSVVITNLYLFLIPAIVFIYEDLLSKNKFFVLGNGLEPLEHKGKPISNPVSAFQWIGVTALTFISLYLSYQLLQFWQADKAYALGNNLDHVNQFQQAYPKLHEAISIRSDEPTFYDEFAFNDAVIGAALAVQKNDQANSFIQEALAASNKIVTDNPNNVVFWKTRVRIFYTLSQANPQYLQQALQAVQVAHQLAPTDAKISYNLGLLYGQNGDAKNGIATLQQTVNLKPNYADAYYALGLFYHELAVDKKGTTTDPAMQQKAVDTLEYLLSHIDPNNPAALKALKSWGVK